MNMRRIILAAVLFCATSGPVLAKAAPQAVCADYAAMAQQFAQDRDEGIAEDEQRKTVRLLYQYSPTPGAQERLALAEQIITAVYSTAVDVPPNAMKGMIYNQCINGGRR
ncbi:YjbH domain-containing protein (plasmid) [Rhodovastum atsumiense]|uniref:YjbH domain-containing protein n=1 Tax=Rhodovastum atsumiense TaxID=504468 RepID=A0A5M6IVS6_9PROT|nr:YjbH domain-containing protein [Rhodovastum atsumiense]KAA5611608.1 YjbH domain-containing protein [Rhodovastum atsumiense]CAH2606307.1 YjbH domain-containing protein [Rhodovastum atsumiense]